MGIAVMLLGSARCLGFSPVCPSINPDFLFWIFFIVVFSAAVVRTWSFIVLNLHVYDSEAFAFKWARGLTG